MPDLRAKQAEPWIAWKNGLEDGITVLHLPQRYRQRLRTSNLAERMNEEIRQRERVICIFPDEDGAMRLIGALFAEKYGEGKLHQSTSI